MPTEYIAMKDADGKVHINTVDTSGVVALAHNVQQFATLADVVAAFPDAVERAFLVEEDSPELWDADADYQPGDRVYHNGETWFALSDVACGQQPDDVYDKARFKTGGWAKF